MERRAVLSPTCYRFLNTRPCTRSLSSRLNGDQGLYRTWMESWSFGGVRPRGFCDVYFFLPSPLHFSFFLSWHIWKECVSVIWWKESESESCSVMSDSLRTHGLYSPWNFPGQNTGVGSLSPLQGIFPTQRSNPGLQNNCRQILYQLSHREAPEHWSGVGFLEAQLHH